MSAAFAAAMTMNTILAMAMAATSPVQWARAAKGLRTTTTPGGWMKMKSR